MPKNAATPAASPKKSRTNALSPLTRMILWAKAAGRCQYSGCNKSLIGDLISGAEDKNFGFVAHIVADTPTGPRGDLIRSPLLSDDVSNLMLLCHVHHKLIDVDAVDQHPEERLLAMKAGRERRVEIVTAIDDDRASHVLRYAANIGGHDSPVAYEQISTAMLPDRYPADGRRTLDIEIRGSAHQDHEPQYWAFQRENLNRQFATKIRERIESREIRHLSVFALAPQPLLIELGRLLCDIAPADVHQLHREPKGWRWPVDGPAMRFRVREPTRSDGPIALVFALSATVTDDRITDVLGADTAIWAIEAEQPHNDIMKRPADLAEFRRLVRSIFNTIKARHGERAVINIFPAMPVSAAVEVGRVWMPKADLPLVVFDQNRTLQGFVRALEIGSSGSGEAAA
ncbi:SAVED domain-containing protein [Acidiphilium rubrum]|uniref:SAVED domain-containing protein n=1 Tax=Acidiphilium rubrum TaxID=526 RepID=UPI002C5DA08E|nr:SAVED domain-containing protein [Acidiphilium rubrum]HQT84991.1 SAVED domain-containing protein [Acidiphilium rubrum]